MPGEQSRPRRGLITALTDTRFTVLVTPLIVRWIYLGCAAMIGCMTLFSLTLALSVATWRNGWLWGVLGFVTAPVVGLVLLLIARVACEFVLIRFQRRP